MKDKPESILTEALRITGGERQENYGHPLANHARIAAVWNGYIEARSINPEGVKLPQIELTAVDVANMMMLLKVARGLHTPKRDNWTDIAGFARCGARIQGFEP